MACFRCDYCGELISDSNLSGECPECTENQFTEVYGSRIQQYFSKDKKYPHLDDEDRDWLISKLEESQLSLLVRQLDFSGKA